MDPMAIFYDNPLSALLVRFRGVFMQWLRISAPLLVAKLLRNIITDTFYPHISSQGYNYYTTFRDPTIRIINNGSIIPWLVPIHELSVKISSIPKIYTCNCLYWGIWYMKIWFECILILYIWLVSDIGYLSGRGFFSSQLHNLRLTVKLRGKWNNRTNKTVHKQWIFRLSNFHFKNMKLNISNYKQKHV